MKEEIVQRLLDIGGCEAETEWAKGYDEGVNNAINVVEEYFKQPQLNENQQIVLEWLKYKYTITDIEPIELFWRFHVNSKNKYRERRAYRAYKSLTSQAQLEVLQVFSQLALEQEELND